MIAKTAPDIVFHVGDTAYFTPDFSKVLFFELDSEKVIPYE